MSSRLEDMKHYLIRAGAGFENELALLNRTAAHMHNDSFADLNNLKNSLSLLLVQIGKLEQAATMVNLARRIEERDLKENE